MSAMTRLIHRLKVEYDEMEKDYPQFKVEKDTSNQFVWYISFKGAEKTLYENENFKLKFEFSPNYVIK